MCRTHIKASCFGFNRIQWHKMIWKVLFLTCIAYSATGKHVKIKNDDERPLKWPSKYSVEATKYYMSSGLTENLKFWKSGRFTRLDAGNGSYIKITKRKILSTTKVYEIYPETTEKSTNKMVCVKSGSESLSSQQFLPSPEDFETQEGTENIKGVDCVKFTNADEPDKVYEKTFWGYFNETANHWVPVRYKTKKFDTWHGYFLEFEIWDFFKFEGSVDINVFNVDFNCTSSKKGVYKVSDRTHDEMKEHINLKKNKPRKAGMIPFPYSKKKVKEIADTLPKEYDLRLEGLVGPVLHTEDCRSTWAFATTAAVEGALARSLGGTWKKLSEQALLDCSWGFGNQGCKGGTDTDSYEWIMEHGLPTEQAYGTYTNRNGFCKMENVTKSYKIKGYTKVTPFSVEALKIALVNHGPLTVTIDSIAAALYEDGVLYDSNCNSSPAFLNLIMTLVGYGERDGDTFWILKHSQGPYWGTGGYIYISARDNNCGVMTKPYYVVV